jgi:hypothetical protein
VDCSGSWSEWSACDKLCGGGVSRRAFTVVTPANSTGQACPVSPQTQSCNTQACPVPINCVGSWSGWSTCDKTCGGGTQSRTYTIATAAQNGGTQCPTTNGARETQACNTQACPVPINCVGSWSGWSTCDKTCGGGTQSRTYTVTTAAQNGGTYCTVPNGARETQACNTQACSATGRTTSCYGTGDAYCKSCVDVVNSYKRKYWAYDINNFEQCKINDSSNRTCYGANNNVCNSCVDVVNAYKGRNWAYDINNFDQCKI